jgi:hypothetical protein
LGFTNAVTAGYIVLLTSDPGGVGVGYYDSNPADPANAIQSNTANWSDVIWWPDNGSGTATTITLLWQSSSFTAGVLSAVEAGGYFIDATPPVTLWDPDAPTDNNYEYYVNAAGGGAVPEPSSMALMFAGLGGLGVFLRKRRSSRG